MTESRGKKGKAWWVYLLRCADGTLYCGSTPDIRARLAAHNGGNGAKYTRARLPVRVAFKRRMADKSSAMREEARIKRLARAEKLALIKGGRRRKSSISLAPKMRQR